MVAEHRDLAIETSGRMGQIGLGVDGRLLADRFLDESRRHARDLMPLCRDLLVQLDWTPASLSAVTVSLGPGSYTGLRVGVMAAKAMAFALECRLIGVPTFDVIAYQAGVNRMQLDVIADALKDKLYVQRFARDSQESRWTPRTDLVIVHSSDWLTGLTDRVAVTGPGLPTVLDRLPSSIEVAPVAQRAAGLSALLTLGHERGEAWDSGSVFSLEPIYLRPSSAEEQWTAMPGRP